MTTPTKPSFTDVFADATEKVWKFKYDTELHVTALTGGIPNDPRVVESWLRTKLQSSDVALEEALAQTQVELGISRDEAIDKTVETAKLNAFKRVDGNLIIEGRNVKAAIKEAFSVALGGGHLKARGWGATNKGITSFVAEHIVIPQRYVSILHEDDTPFTEPTEVQQRFVHTFRGSGIQYEEVCDPAVLRFQVWSDWDFSKEWPIIWPIGGKQGIGATRSQGCGVYFVSKWEQK